VSGVGARGVRVRGIVVSFDTAEGLGRITLDDGEEVAFHATQLADGSRTIEVGRRVVVTVVPWHLGRHEATDVAGA
jgi:cold shock CspA family protein